SGALALEGDASVPAYVQALLEQTADGLERMQRAIVDSERERQAGQRQLGEIGNQLARLNDVLGHDVRERQAGAEARDELRAVLRTLAAQAPAGVQLSEELRAELRLLSRTIAAALDGRRERPAIDR